MRAARFHGQLDIRIDEIPRPVPKENEVLVDIEWCGLCGTDLHEYEHGPTMIPRDGYHHPITKEVMPITMGHEFCGRISQASPNSSLKVGQAVMVDPRLYCSSCSRCKASATQACYIGGFHGLSGSGGGLSETVAIDASMCYELPDNVDLSVAALIEPLAVANHAIKNSRIKGFSSKSVLILGGGPIGLAVADMLRTKGAKKVFVSEPAAKRQQQNLEVAEAVFNPLEEKVGERCRELTGGEGVDVVFDCAGIEPAMRDGMDALRHGGVYLNVAGWVAPFVLPQEYFMLKEITVIPSLAYNDEDFLEVVEGFRNGAFPGMEKFVTSRIILEDVVEKGFRELMSNKDHHIKILVSPKSEYFQKA